MTSKSKREPVVEIQPSSYLMSEYKIVVNGHECIPCDVESSMGMTYNEAKAYYRKLHPDVDCVVAVECEEDGSIIITRLEDRNYLPPYVRFYQDGTYEYGVWWGGDVWDIGGPSDPASRKRVADIEVKAKERSDG